MIIFASGRTDIPAFYSNWFLNRIKAGFVDVRNPYNNQQVTRYKLSPDVVDCLVFCTKITDARLLKPGIQNLREHCLCIPMRDIAYYNWCPHLCRYCYANYDKRTVVNNVKLHDPESSFLIGESEPGDIIHIADQKSFKDIQLELF